MYDRCLIIARIIATLGALVGPACPVLVAQATVEGRVGGSKGRRPLGAEIIAAWKKAGAKTGWMDLRDQRSIAVADEIPDLCFFRWEAGIIEKLPVPAVPFGLAFYQTELTDAGLKEVSRLTSVKSLNVSDSQVTDVGMKDLARLKNLKCLYLRAYPRMPAARSVTHAQAKWIKAR